MNSNISMDDGSVHSSPFHASNEVDWVFLRNIG